MTKYFILIIAAVLTIVSAVADDNQIAADRFKNASTSTVRLRSTEATVEGKLVQTPHVIVEGAGEGGASEVELTGAELTPTIAANVEDGAIASGCKSLLLIASDDFDGTVLANFALPAGSSINIPVPPGHTLGAVAFTVAVGTLYSVEVR